MVLVHGHVDGYVFESFDFGVGQHFAIDDVLDFFEFFVGHLCEVGEVEAQPVWSDERAGLLYVRAQHLPESGVEKVRAGVVAADGVATLAVDDGVDAVADGEIALEDGLVRADALHGKHATGDFGNGFVPIGGGEPAGVADLAAGVAVEAGVVEDDLDLLAGFGRGNADAVFHDGEDFAVGRGEGAVAFESGPGQIAVGGAGGFLPSAFPGSAGASLFFGAGALEAFVIEGHAGVARGVDHEI